MLTLPVDKIGLEDQSLRTQCEVTLGGSRACSSEKFLKLDLLRLALSDFQGENVNFYKGEYDAFLK